jgi:hypothetical protein
VDQPRNSQDIDVDYAEYDDQWEYDSTIPVRKRNRTQAKQQRTKRSSTTADRKRRAKRVESRDGTFRCRQCKTIVGPPISGVRHRNHCPLCLYSRHVDRTRPGDRAEECQSMMPAAGVFTRRDGEQMLLHVCSGCGVERRNRIAADDNMVTLMRLPVLHETKVEIDHTNTGD